MENSPIQAPLQKYQTLGEDVFWFFILENSIIPLLFFIFGLATFVITFQKFLQNTLLHSAIEQHGLKAGAVLVMLSIIFEAVAVFAAWLHYITYTYLLTEDSLRIKKGIINKIEISIPYRQIQNVTVERKLFFQILGLSKLIILTAGDDETSKVISERDLSEGVIYAIEKKKAEVMQAELLKRSSIQKVVQHNS